MENQGLPRTLVMGIAGLIFIVLFGSSMFVTIEPGEKGVLFKKFGGGLDKETVYDQGFHIIAPWNTMHVYDVRFKDTFEKMEVLSKNGLSIKIDLSFRYQPVSSQIGYLHDNVGKDYLERIIKPEIRSVTREVIGNYLPEELYSTKREVIEDEMDDCFYFEGRANHEGYFDLAFLPFLETKRVLNYTHNGKDQLEINLQ